jgi:hypothetical protein
VKVPVMKVKRMAMKVPVTRTELKMMGVGVNV